MSAWALHYDVSVRRGEMSLALEVSICALFYVAISPFLSASSKSYTLLLTGTVQNEIS